MRTLSLTLMAATLLVAALLLGGSQPAGADPPGPTAPKNGKGTADSDVTDILGANAACYVCHMTFVKEELAKTHLAAKVGCIKCHGPSTKHANDEHIGATKPDITFQRRQVDAMCGKCHKGHDVAAGKIVARFVERKLPTGTAPLCTECHGTHKIAKAAEKP